MRHVLAVVRKVFDAAGLLVELPIDPGVWGELVDHAAVVVPIEVSFVDDGAFPIIAPAAELEQSLRLAMALVADAFLMFGFQVNMSMGETRGGGAACRPPDGISCEAALRRIGGVSLPSLPPCTRTAS